MPRSERRALTLPVPEANAFQPQQQIHGCATLKTLSNEPKNMKDTAANVTKPYKSCGKSFTSEVNLCLKECKLQAGGVRCETARWRLPA